MRIGNDTLIESPVTLNQNFTLIPVWLGHIEHASIQLVFTGTPDGVFSLEASNDKGDHAQSGDLKSTNVTNWTNITGSEQQILAAGDHVWQIENIGFRWIRVVYTFTSSTGSLTIARFNVKGV